MSAWQQLFVGRDAELERLRVAWAAARAGAPQVVALVAESGYGKTRLAQEFFAWLSTEQDGAGDAGYWPDRLVREADNLLVNPDPVTCTSALPMPFLWWGLRLADPGARNQTVVSAVAAAQEPLRAHLEAYDRRVRIAALRRQQATGGGLNATDIGLNVVGMAVPGLSTVFGLIGLGKTLVQGSAEAVRLQNEINALQKPADQAQRADQRRLDLVDLVVNDLRTAAHAPPEEMRPVPLVLLIDDAQWSRQDDTLCAFVAALLAVAGRERWPLLVVATCWEQEWRRADAGGVGTLFQAPGVTTTALLLGDAPDLDQVARAAFPGLTTAQQALIAERADGNPRFVDEVLRRLERSSGLFVDGDPAGPLNAQGEKRIGAQTFEAVVLDRLQACPPHVQGALSIASLQGVRFSARVVRATAGRLKLARPDQGLAEADAPYAFVRTETDAAGEFRARVYQRVARANLANLADEEAAEAALREVLASLAAPAEADPAAEEEAWEAQLALLDSVEPDQRTQGLAALAQLVDAAHRRFDLRTERKLALRWIGEWQRGNATSTVSNLITVSDALLRNDEVHRAMQLSRTAVDVMDRAVVQNPSPENLEDQVLALERAGDTEMRESDFETALDLFNRGLFAAKRRFAADPTLSAATMVSIMHFKVGRALEDLRGPAAAELALRDACRLVDQGASGNVASERALAAAQSQLSKVLRRLGRPAEAIPLSERALNYWEKRLSDHADHEASREIIPTLTNLAMAQCDTGAREEALASVERALLFASGILEHNDTIGANRDVLDVTKVMAYVQQRLLGPAAALPMFVDVLQRTEDLVRREPITEHLLNLSESLNNVGGSYIRLKDAPRALSFYERSVKICLRAEVRRGSAGQEALEESLLKIAYAYLDALRPVDAAAALRKAVALVDEHVGSGNREKRARTLELLNLLAKALRAAGDPAGAAGPLGRAATMYGEVAAERPTTADRYEHSVSLVQYADALVADDRSAEALATFKDAEAINRDFLAQDTAAIWRQQAVVTQRIGNLLRPDDAAAALSWHTQSLTAFERTAELSPADAPNADMILALDTLAATQLAAGARADALATYRRGADARGRLAAADDPAAIQAHKMALMTLGNAMLSGSEEGDASAFVSVWQEILAVAERSAKAAPTPRSLVSLAYAQLTVARLDRLRWHLFSAARGFWASFRTRRRATALLQQQGWTRQEAVAAWKTMLGNTPVALPGEAGAPANSEPTPSPTPPDAPAADGPETRPVDEWIAAAGTAPEPTIFASRNAPCPCGSGERYKNCHGKVAPG